MTKVGSGSAAVVVATVGKASLRRTIDAILGQSHAECTAVVVIDGPAFVGDAMKALEPFRGSGRVEVVALPQNTGANGYVCHRIYGAIPLLVNQDFVFYCDDDNWYEPGHVQACVAACETHGLHWCCALRNIYSDGKFLCRDECESVGMWPVWSSKNVFHVDTNCYCIRREAAVELAPLWHRSRLKNGVVQRSADTAVCQYLRSHFPRHGLVPTYSVNYELGSWHLSPSPEFFLRGNAAFLEQLGGVLPWKSRPAS